MELEVGTIGFRARVLQGLGTTWIFVVHGVLEYSVEYWVTWGDIRYKDIQGHIGFGVGLAVRG